MLTKIDIREYKEQKNKLKKRFEDEKTGDQNIFIDQERLFKPLIETQEKTSKAIQDKIVTSQEATSNALVPIAKELQKRIDQVETLQDLPFYNIPPGIEDVPQSTPQKDRDIINVNLDKGLDDTHRENLLLLELDLPSEVQKKGMIEDTLKKIKHKNRSLGQAGRDDKSVKKSTTEKLMIESQKETMKIYKESILALKGAEKFTSKSGEGMRKLKPFKLKRGRGRPKTYPDTIMYNNSQDLHNKLLELLAAKKAGNTGLDNTIISALDELFNKKWISKDNYDHLFKSFFT
jgi:hypothetical protein